MITSITELLAPNTIIHGAHGEYKILGVIGRGGMGAVYRAQRLADGAVWALKEIDFGVARTYKKSKSKDTVAMGSAGYAPPEQYGKGQTDARSDVYALGATLLHLLTNMPPIPLQTPAPGSIRKMNPSVDPQTEQAIIRAMALDPKVRYQD